MESEKKTDSEKRKIYLEHSLELLREKKVNRKFSRKLLAGLFILGFVFYFVVVWMSDDFSLSDFKLLIRDSSILLFGLVVSLLFPSIYVLGYLLEPGQIKAKEQELINQLNALGANVLQETIEDDFFNNLVKLNYKYIDKYYLQTQIQADRSFILCVFAAVFSFAIIILGIILMYTGKTGNEYSSYVTISAGTLGEFISAVFFYLYNKTTLKMSEYHQKLVLTQNINLALKISEELPGDSKVKSKEYLIKELTKDINSYLNE